MKELEPSPAPNTGRTGFTLIEVMVALAVVAIGLVALLGLQHQSMESVIRANQLSTAALLAQETMTQMEVQVYPPLGQSAGDFRVTHGNEFPNFRWQTSVEANPVFPDVRQVQVTVLYGPRFTRRFDLVEMLRNPMPMPVN